MANEEPRESSYDKISLFRTEKSGPFLNLFRVLATCIEQMSDADKTECLEFILSHAHIGEWIGTVLGGSSNHEWTETSSRNENREIHSADKIREALLPFADTATVTLLKHVSEQNLRLVNRVRDLQTQIKQLIEKWPETHKQYVPKPEWNFQSSYVPEWDLRKLLDVVKEKPDLLGIPVNDL